MKTTITLAILFGTLSVSTIASGSVAPQSFALPAVRHEVPETMLLEAQSAIQRGVNHLLSKQMPDGSWSGDPAITALCALSLYQSHAEENKTRLYTALDKAMKFYMKFQQGDGSFAKDGRYVNYTTSIVLTTMAIMNRPQDQASMLKARHYLLDLQLDEDNALHPTTDSSPYYGGIGYGTKKPGDPARPDLSNTQLALEALALTEHLEGESTPEGQKWKKKSDLAWNNALKFLRHCQNIPESADAQWIVSDKDSAHDGGFVYKPDESKAGGNTDGTSLRSYGSMTYAGLKSMIYAKLKKDDFRIKAARQWAAEHYTLSENPGMGPEGLYYYLHTFAKANAVFGEATLTDKNGKVHHWREDVVRALLNYEKDGIWSNKQGRWMESLPELTTAYSLLSFEIALGDQLKKR